MNFTFDVALKRDNIFYKYGEDYSPYYELAFSSINEREVLDEVVEVNPFYRFTAIFDEFLDVNYTGNSELKEYLFDIFMQLITESDLKHGLSKREFYIRKVKREIEQGALGLKASNTFNTMDYETKNKLSQLYLLQLETGTSLLIFRKAIRYTFEDSILYRNKEKLEDIIVYIERSKNEKFQKQLSYIADVFLPLEFNLIEFWENHFGIFGIESTLILDETILF